MRSDTGRGQDVGEVFQLKEVCYMRAKTLIDECTDEQKS